MQSEQIRRGPASTWQFIRLIAALKFKLALRHFARNMTNAVGIGAAMLGGLGLIVGGGFIMWMLVSQGIAPQRTVLLWAYWIISVIWVISPLSMADAQRSLDFSSMRLMPVSLRRFITAVLADGLVSPTGIVLSLALLTAGVVVAQDAMQVLWGVLLALLLILLNVALSQAVLLAGNRIISSRRFADVSIVLGMLLFFGIQAGNLYFNVGRDADVPQWLATSLEFIRGVTGPVANWLPPGLAANSYGALGSADYTALLLYLLILAGAVYIAVMAMAAAAVWFYESDVESGGTAAKSKATGGVQFAWIKGGIGSMYWRELVYLIRDPVMKTLFLQSLFFGIYILLMAGFFSMRGSELFTGELFGDAATGYILFGLAMMLSYSESAVLFNKFGGDGQQVSTLLLTPISRRQILLGKSAFLLSTYAAVNFLLLACVALVVKVQPVFIVGALLLILFNTALVDLLGHFVSIWFPFGYRRKGNRMRAVMPQPGCGYIMLYGLVYNVCNLLVAPGSALIILGTIFYGWPGLLVGAVLYAALIAAAYALALPLAERQLIEREPLILEALSRAGD